MGYLYLSKCTKMSLLKPQHSHAPASLSLTEHFGSRLWSIGRPYAAWNSRSEPRNPGIRKSNNDHSSSTLFCMGVPVSTSRWLQLNCLTAFDNCKHTIAYMCSSQPSNLAHSETVQQLLTKSKWQPNEWLIVDVNCIFNSYWAITDAHYM